jgi:PIN domain nuclease of toxin-antitoxin system
METVVYLDTHVVVFLYESGAKRIGRKARILIEENPIRISPIVRLELQYLFETGRTNLPARDVIEELAEQIGLAVCDQSFIDVVKVAEGLEWIRDPFDRIIVAHAMLADAYLITKDRYIRRHYEKTVWG